jgi:hypothetical protein
MSVVLYGGFLSDWGINGGTGGSNGAIKGSMIMGFRIEHRENDFERGFLRMRPWFEPN